MLHNLSLVLISTSCAANISAYIEKMSHSYSVLVKLNSEQSVYICFTQHGFYLSGTKTPALLPFRYTSRIHYLLRLLMLFITVPELLKIENTF